MNNELDTVSQAYFDNQLIMKLQIKPVNNEILDNTYGLLSNTFVKTMYPLYLAINIQPAKDSQFTFSGYNCTEFSLLNIITIFFPAIANKYKYRYFSNNDKVVNNIIYELRKEEADWFNTYTVTCNYRIMLKPFALKKFNLYTAVTSWRDYYYNDYDDNVIGKYNLLTNSSQENDLLAETFAKYRLLELDKKWNENNE